MSIETVYEPEDEEIKDLRELYDSYPWWEGREPEAIRRMVEHTDELVCLRDTDTGRLVAAGRVLTDYVYYAKIYDVIVAESRRQEGLGQRLMNEIVDHPELSGVDPVLDCREGLVPFYKRCGFERHDGRVEIRDRTEDLVTMVPAGD